MFMPDEQQSPKSVPETPELSGSEGARNAEVPSNVQPEASQSAPAQEKDKVETPRELDFINRSTGRQYKTLEEAEKGLKETVGYVGTLGQKASVVEKLVKRIAKEQNVSEDAALQYVQAIAEQQQAASAPQVEETNDDSEAYNPPPQVPPPLYYESQKLSQKVNELELLRKHPDAEQHLELIGAISKSTGEDYAQVYEKRIAPLVEVGRKQAYETQDAKAGAAPIRSGKEQPAVDEYGGVFEKFQQGKASVVDVLKAKGIIKR